MRYTKDLTGQRFGKLVALKPTEMRGSCRSIIWKCKCDCGNYPNVSVKDLNSSEGTRSCGCSRKGRKITHGMSKNPLYYVWSAMKQRCYNPKNHNYRWYGAKGIKVCEEWKDSIKAFYDWAINNGYKKGLVIDRIDSTGNYEPSNCQWITAIENGKRSRAGKSEEQ